MDISTYTWVDTCVVKSPSTSSTLSTSPSMNTLKIVIGVLSGIVGITALSIIGLIVHRLRKKRRNEILNIPGS